MRNLMLIDYFILPIILKEEQSVFNIKIHQIHNTARLIASMLPGISNHSAASINKKKDGSEKKNYT